MDGHPALRVIVQVLGLLLVAYVLLDVFLTVLYARIGTGVISHPLSCLAWRTFRGVTRCCARRPQTRDKVLCFCGPTILVLLVFTWAVGFATGVALFIWPALGTGMRNNAGPTPTNFVTAFYIAGDSMTTVGASDMSPQTPLYRLVFFGCSLVGISLITLTLTYYLEIYNALQRRNTFTTKVHLATAETGDAAELIAAAGARGQFTAGYTLLAEMSAEMIAFAESHHFYSVLLYFRFREAHYAISRLVLVTLDTVSLIKSALDDEEYGWVKESAAANMLWRASMALLTLLATSFLPSGLIEPDAQTDDAATQERWRRRYRAAVRRLKLAGIRTTPSDDAGAEIYVSLRAHWDRYVRGFADHMVHEMSVIDPAGEDPAGAESRQDLQTPLHSVG